MRLCSASCSRCFFFRSFSSRFRSSRSCCAVAAGAFSGVFPVSRLSRLSLSLSLSRSGFSLSLEP